MEDEQPLWEAVLTHQGLSVDQGSSPRWLTYGWDYRDSDTPAPYGDKPPHKKTAANKPRAERFLALLAEGMSEVKAAKQLGIPRTTARSLLQIYRANLTLTKTRTQVEETNEGELFDEAYEALVGRPYVGADTGHTEDDLP